MSLSHDLQFAIELARGAGKIALDHYGKVERLTKTHSAATDAAIRTITNTMDGIASGRKLMTRILGVMLGEASSLAGGPVCRRELDKGRFRWAMTGRLPLYQRRCRR